MILPEPLDRLENVFSAHSTILWNELGSDFVLVTSDREKLPSLFLGNGFWEERIMLETRIRIGVVMIGLLLMAVALGCQQADEMVLERPVAVVVESERASMAVAKQVSSDAMAASGDAAAPMERKIVRNAQMSIVVDDVDAVVSRVTGLVAAQQGFVVHSSRFGTGEEERASMSFRVPSEELDSVLAQIREWATTVDNEQTSARDVTEEFIDTEARLNSLKATEAKYLDLLTRAETVEETLNVQRELENVRYRIESSEGRLRFLRQTTSLSLVNLEISTTERAKPLLVAGWNLTDMATSAIRGLISTARAIVNVLIWVVVFIQYGCHWYSSSGGYCPDGGIGRRPLPGRSTKSDQTPPRNSCPHYYGSC